MLNFESICRCCREVTESIIYHCLMINPPPLRALVGNDNPSDAATHCQAQVQFVREQNVCGARPSRVCAEGWRHNRGTLPSFVICRGLLLAFSWCGCCGFNVGLHFLITYLLFRYMVAMVLMGDCTFWFHIFPRTGQFQVQRTLASFWPAQLSIVSRGTRPFVGLGW